MRSVERNAPTHSVLNAAVTSRVAAAMARKVATSEGFAEDIASALTEGMESDPHVRQLMITSALSSLVLRETLIRKIQRELR